MQNTITARRISYTWVAIVVALVAVALLVGFAAGFTVGKPSTATLSTVPAAQVVPQPASLAPAGPNTPTEGWVYYQNHLTAKWYSVHYSITPTGPIIDESYEIQGEAARAVNTCGTTMFEPECFGSAGYSIQAPTIDGCKVKEINKPDC